MPDLRTSDAMRWPRTGSAEAAPTAPLQRGVGIALSLRLVLGDALTFLVALGFEDADGPRGPPAAGSPPGRYRSGWPARQPADASERLLTEDGIHALYRKPGDPTGDRGAGFILPSHHVSSTLRP